MGFLSKFEGRMEDTFEGAADKMFDAPISPVQIAKKAEKQMRREKMVGAGKQYAPTLYTVLVNADDDQRLFGYYPTLAGETETYLAAKAAEQGLVMDGQPLVRFIVDDSLKHGKFDVIAEAVAAPIVAQLRNEEMQRYGLAAPAGAAFGGGYAQSAYPQQAYGAPAGQGMPQAGYPAANRGAAQGYPQAQAYGQQGYGAQGHPGAQTYDDLSPENLSHQPLPYVPEDELDYSIDYGEYTFNSRDFNAAGYDEYRDSVPLPSRPVAQQPQAQRASQTFDQRASQPFDQHQHASQPLQQRASQPLQQRASQPLQQRASQPINPAAAAGVAAGAAAVGAGVAAGMAPGASAVPGATGAATHGVAQAAAAAQPGQTVAFVGGVPQGAVQARLVDTNTQRAYDLVGSRLSLGRESKNSITIPDINASRCHAELTLSPQGVWVLTDLGSTNGTFVNGREIASQPLTNGDRITIGTTNFVFSQA
ncbi:FhaA domain-containing protein [Adlercreutzia agrestimuris]|uniref:FhaA domain-containing protein n=1 Tax=Adlercreutzia agrestimuris TaxID=2941324 RepID=UPI00203CF630|nr:FhaA domain-containing protein [Adlercreutzia agrestimuris]